LLKHVGWGISPSQPLYPHKTTKTKRKLEPAYIMGRVAVRKHEPTKILRHILETRTLNESAKTNKIKNWNVELNG